MEPGLHNLQFATFVQRCFKFVCSRIQSSDSFKCPRGHLDFFFADANDVETNIFWKNLWLCLEIPSMFHS